jgi:hypothetical protein
MAPVTQARWSALPPRLRLPAPAAADGVAATSFSRNCNVTELVVSYLSPCSSIAFRFRWSGVRVDKNSDMIAPLDGRSLPSSNKLRIVLDELLSVIRFSRNHNPEFRISTNFASTDFYFSSLVVSWCV